MHRISSDTAQVDKFGAGKNGWTEGTPPLVLPTKGTEAWFDEVQETLGRFIEGSGVALAEGEYDQLTQAFGIRSAINAMRNIEPGTTGAAAACNGIVYGRTQYMSRGIWVAVHDGGVIRTSFDLITWTTRTSGTSDGLFSVAFNGEQFVAVGANGVIAYSDAGETWIDANVGAVGYNSVCWSETLGLWVAVGSTGTIRTSPDAITWTTRTSGTTAELRSVAASADRIVAITSTNGFFVSADAATWPPVAFPSGLSFGRRVRHIGGRFVATGRHMNGGNDGPGSATSVDGLVWVAGTRLEGWDDWAPGADPETQIQDVAYLQGVYIATTTLAGGAMATSLDGLAWTIRLDTGPQWQRIEAGGERVAVYGDPDDTDAVGRSPRVQP